MAVSVNEAQEEPEDEGEEAAAGAYSTPVERPRQQARSTARSRDTPDRRARVARRGMPAERTINAQEEHGGTVEPNDSARRHGCVGPSVRGGSEGSAMSERLRRRRRSVDAVGRGGAERGALREMRAAGSDVDSADDDAEWARWAPATLNRDEAVWHTESHWREEEQAARRARRSRGSRTLTDEVSNADWEEVEDTAMLEAFPRTREEARHRRVHGSAARRAQDGRSRRTAWNNAHVDGDWNTRRGARRGEFGVGWSNGGQFGSDSDDDEVSEDRWDIWTETRGRDRRGRERGLQLGGDSRRVRL